jgi:hypothetical protein
VLTTWRERWGAQANELTFCAPASETAVQEIIQKLGPGVPEDLVSVLRESNGVLGPYSLDLVWSAERILRDNLDFRSNREFQALYMSFDSAMFFGDGGNGDQFFFPVLGSGDVRSEVFVWNHEDDSRTWVAQTLEIFVMWYLDGTIKI